MISIYTTHYNRLEFLYPLDIDGLNIVFEPNMFAESLTDLDLEPLVDFMHFNDEESTTERTDPTIDQCNKCVTICPPWRQQPPHYSQYEIDIAYLIYELVNTKKYNTPPISDIICDNKNFLIAVVINIIDILNNISIYSVTY